MDDQEELDIFSRLTIPLIRSYLLGELSYWEFSGKHCEILNEAYPQEAPLVADFVEEVASTEPDPIQQVRDDMPGMGSESGLRDSSTLFLWQLENGRVGLGAWQRGPASSLKADFWVSSAYVARQRDGKRVDVPENMDYDPDLGLVFMNPGQGQVIGFYPILPLRSLHQIIDLFSGPEDEVVDGYLSGERDSAALYDLARSGQNPRLDSYILGTPGIRVRWQRSEFVLGRDGILELWYDSPHGRGMTLLMNKSQCLEIFVALRDRVREYLVSLNPAIAEIPDWDTDQMDRAIIEA